jgi:hypothetical protein
MTNEPAELNGFTYLEHTGFVAKDLMSKFTRFAVGRWTGLSLYTLYKEGLDAGNLETALNLIGLMGDDLSSEEMAAANRVYLMARARTLAIIKGQLSNNAGSAKEAELLLKSMYGISEAEGGVLGTGFSINIQQAPAMEHVVEIVDPDNIAVEFESDDEEEGRE